MTHPLLNPIQVGEIQLKNKIVMAPLTRSRSGSQRIPNDMMATYYKQRASAGLILTEATSICDMGVGYEDTPGIWNQEQIDGWKKVTHAVHQEEGKIFLQLWHVGRISHPLFLNGRTPVAPSPIAPKGHVSLVRPKTEYVTPRALLIHEIKKLVETYKNAALNAMEANFDGVEIHAANGYLIDQFIQSSTNKRDDEYGGSIENRARFLLEIVDSICDVLSSKKVGVHLAPAGDSHDMGDDHPVETFSYIAKELSKRNIAFIFTRETPTNDNITSKMKNHFNGPIIANQGLNVDMATSLVKSQQADLVSFGRYYISNPDLVERIENNIDLAPFDESTFYTKGPRGYIDYENATI